MSSLRKSRSRDPDEMDHSGATGALEALLIEALYEAEGVYAGQFTNDEITERRRKLMRLRHEAEVKHFPTGNLPERRDLLELADAAAADYFDSIFGPRTIQ